MEKEIDIFGLLKRLWDKRRFIFISIGCFAVLGLAIAIFTPVQFSASCTFVPQTRAGGTKSSLSSLAAMAGINIGDFSSSETVSPYVYPQLISNARLKRELMETPLTIAGEDRPVPLYDYFTTPDYHKFNLVGTMYKYTFGLPGLLKAALLKKKQTDSIMVGSSDNAEKLVSFSTKEYAVYKQLEGAVSITLNDKNGYIVIQGTMPEARAAAQVTQRTFELLQEYITRIRQEKAQSDLQFITERYEEARQDMERKRRAYAQFMDANRVLSNKVASEKEEQLKNDYNLANMLYTDLASRQMQAQINVKEDTPVLSIVQPVVVPTERSKPKRSKILLGFLFMGGVLGCGCVFLLDYIKNETSWKRLNNW